MNINIILSNLFLTNNKNTYLLSNTNYTWKILLIKFYNECYCGFFGYYNRGDFKNKYKICKNLTVINELMNRLIENKNTIKLYTNLKKVVEISLYYRGLKKLPKEIGLLINVERFYLNDNNLYILPTDIGNLINLTNIYLQRNKLSNLPIQFKNLNNLKILPVNFGNLINLNRIDLENNKLSNLPIKFNKLVKLIHLNLGNNLFTEIPKSIIKLTNLSTLNFNFNQLKFIPDNFDKLVNLQYLYLSNNQFTNKYTKKFALLPILLKVVMQNNLIPKMHFIQIF
jgi:Leucine-rich repeat (LRR) protein